MSMDSWQTKRQTVASLQLDPRNPRLGQQASERSAREIIKYLFDHDKAGEVAESIASTGFFPNEPLLAVNEDDRWVVVEGNRRLAALKVLRDPTLLEGKHRSSIERLLKRYPDAGAISGVPTTMAPDRRSTDRILSRRHVGTPVRSWEAENRASFILEKLADGYEEDELRTVLGFSAGEIQKARQTKAIADMARSLELPPAVRDKLDNPRAQVFSTIGRVFDSTVGRKYLRVEPDQAHGLRGTTSREEFIRGFTRLVTDVAKGTQTSRKLNTSTNIEAYFKSWKRSELPAAKKDTFVPSDIIKGTASAGSTRAASAARGQTKRGSNKVLPSNFHVRKGTKRLRKIRDELCRLDRRKFENAGAVLLRVFLELSVEHYLAQTGKLAEITEDLRKKGKLNKYNTPELRYLLNAVVEIAKKELQPAAATKVARALKYDPDAPFSIQELHAFVHSHDLPSARDIETFWDRTEPLFRLMLE